MKKQKSGSIFLLDGETEMGLGVKYVVVASTAKEAIALVNERTSDIIKIEVTKIGVPEDPTPRIIVSEEP